MSDIKLFSNSIRSNSYEDLQKCVEMQNPIKRKTANIAKNFFAAPQGTDNPNNPKGIDPINTLYRQANEALKTWSSLKKCCSAFANWITGQGFLSSPQQILRSIHQNKVETLASELSLLKSNTTSPQKKKVGNLVKKLIALKPLEMNESTRELLTKTLSEATKILDPACIPTLQKAEKALIEKYQQNIKTLEEILLAPGFQKMTEEDWQLLKESLTEIKNILTDPNPSTSQSKPLKRKLLNLVKKVENKKAIQIIQKAHSRLEELRQSQPDNLAGTKKEVLTVINNLESLNDLELTKKTDKLFIRTLDEAKKLLRKLTSAIEDDKKPSSHSNDEVEL